MNLKPPPQTGSFLLYCCGYQAHIGASTFVRRWPSCSGHQDFSLDYVADLRGLCPTCWFRLGFGLCGWGLSACPCRVKERRSQIGLSCMQAIQACHTRHAQSYPHQSSGEDSVGIGHTLGGTARPVDRKLAGIRGWLARYDRLGAELGKVLGFVCSHSAW